MIGRRVGLRQIVADAPGRVNLIGEHTDYNGGYVLPTAIPQRTRVALRVRPDRQVVARTDVEASPGAYELGAEAPGRGWLDYVQGITWVLAREGFSVAGMELEIASEVPAGSGLSSSAALEVSLLRALRAAFDLPLDDVRLAWIGQRAENEFIGARVGIMDQMAASLADERTALFLDTRSLAYERVPLLAATELVVIHSGISHSHAAGAYNTRRAECERACELLGVGQLRDLDLEDLPRVEGLPEPLGRRARHVVTEDARVLDAVAALRAGDAERLGDLLDASHASLRDDFEVSTPEVDLLVDLARREPGVLGARLTGGGFGGAIVALVRRGEGAAAGQQAMDRYAARTGRHPTLLLPGRPVRAAAGNG